MEDDIYHCGRSGAEETNSPSFCFVLHKITEHNNAGGTTRNKWQPMQLHETGKSKERFCNHIRFGTEKTFVRLQGNHRD